MKTLLLILALVVMPAVVSAQPLATTGYQVTAGQACTTSSPSVTRYLGAIKNEGTNNAYLFCPIDRHIYDNILYWDEWWVSAQGVFFAGDEVRLKVCTVGTNYAVTYECSATMTGQWPGPLQDQDYWQMSANPPNPYSMAGNQAYYLWVRLSPLASLKSYVVVGYEE